MNRSDDLRKMDVIDACTELEKIVALRGNVEKEVLLRAAERLLEIIGEAASNCSESLRATYPQVDWVGLAGLRVVLAQHYHRTDSELIWKFATTNAPEFYVSLATP